MLDAVVKVNHLEKSYGAFRALDGFDLQVPSGSIYGFLGPNGAGKTTTIRILLGLLRRNGGEATVLDLDAWKDSTEIHRRVGYLPGDVQFQGVQTGGRFLDFCDSVRGGTHQDEYLRLARVFDLDLKKKVRNFSRGMKQKLGLIQALMHRPELLILDEPTSGLDPLMQQTLYDELRRVAAEGRTVLFSSHTLSEVDLLCDRVCVIRRGKAVETNTMTALREKAPRRVAIALANHSDLPPPRGGQFQRTESHDGRATGVWTGPPAALLDWLRVIELNDVEIGPPTLEELFAQLYKNDDSGTDNDESLIRSEQSNGGDRGKST